MEKKDVPEPQKSNVPAPQESIAPDPGKRPLPTFYLKVRLHCCATCYRRAKERLQKIQGVVAINVDTKQELLAVSGTVEPQKIIEKFAEWGKKAVLWTPQKDAAQVSNDNTNLGRESNAQNLKKADDCCCTEDDSDSESADDHHSSTVTWRHPDLMNKLAAAPKTDGGKNHCWLWRLFGKTKNGDKSQGAGAKSNSRPNVMRPAFNSFPPRRPLLATYGAPMSFYPPYSYGSTYRMPMMYERPAMPPYPGPAMPPYPGPAMPPYPGPAMPPYPGPAMPPYPGLAMPPYPFNQPTHLVPPPAPPYGFSEPISPRLSNPMIHYTRYEDNYT